MKLFLEDDRRYNPMKKLAHISLLICCVLFSFIANGQEFSMAKTIKEAPSPKRLVNDYTTILTEGQRQALENKLVQFDNTTSTQITVVIVPRLDGMDVADAATELGRNWGVGQQKNNNGVVLLISEEDHKLNISPGYGLEGVLPDITCKQIIDDIIVPKFKGKDYYRGIDEGTDAIIQATKGEFKATASSGKKGLPLGRIIFYIVMIVVFLGIFSGGSKGGGGSFMSRRGASAWMLGSMLGGGGSGSGWGGGGSSGGGGFGGFGGGGFGGGGSSGSW